MNESSNVVPVDTIPTGRTGNSGGLAMKKPFLGGMALAAMIAGPAMAADMPVKVKAPPPVVVYDWSGAYVGFSIGGVWTDTHRHYPFAPLFGAPSDYKISGDDVIYGLHAGAQWQWGQWVLGVEAGYSAGFREMQSTLALPAQGFGSDVSAYSKITNLFTVGPRLGFAWDRWMIYGTGGWASADIKSQYITTSTGVQIPPGIFVLGASRHDGWFAGGGLEYMVHKGALVDVVFGAEYLHFDLRTKDIFHSNLTDPISESNFQVSAKGDIVRTRLTIKTQGWGFSEPAAKVIAKY